MTKEELIQDLYRNQIITIQEAELLLEPTFMIGIAPMPNYQANSTGDFKLLNYQMN